MRSVNQPDGLTFVVVAVAVSVVAFAAASILGGCRTGELAAPCDEATLAQVTADCRTQVRAQCARDAGVVDESCPTLKACDARIKSWLACHVGDAGADQ